MNAARRRTGSAPTPANTTSAYLGAWCHTVTECAHGVMLRCAFQALTPRVCQSLGGSRHPLLAALPSHDHCSKFPLLGSSMRNSA